MNLTNTLKRCLTNTRTSMAVGGLLLAALVPSQAAFGQTCGATMQPTLTPADTIFAVGQDVTINLTFGPTAAAGGSMSITQVTVLMDCENASGCDIGNPCTDDGNVLSYNGDATIVNACPGVAITSNHPGGGTSNELIFTFTPALVLPTATQCTFSFDVNIVTLSTDNSPKVISGIGFFTGTCASGGLTGSACGTYQIMVVSPDILIEKTACPSLVCATGENVVYTYVVTTGAGNAPISNVEVTDNECAPVTPTLQADGIHNVGDVNDNDLLEPGEEWEFTCSAFITEPTTNIATVTGVYINAKGEVPVEDDDTMTVDVVTVNVTDAVCGTTYTAKTGVCTGETCSWTGPGDFTSSQCQITLGAGNAPGQYCVTVTCPGGEEDCPHNCGEPGAPPCEPLAATCCIEFTPPVPPTVEVVGTPDCVGGDPTLCAIVTGGRAPYSVQWSQGGNPVGAPCNVASSGGQCCLPIPPAPGVEYTATATDDNGCTGADDGSVDSLPNRMVSVDDVTICADDVPEPLCATVSGGRAPYTVDWFVCNDGVAGGAILGTCIVANEGGSCCFQPTGPGNYLARATDDNGCIGTDCGVYTVTPLPPCSINTGPTEVCVGDTGQYCGPANMDSYAWSEDSAACSITSATNVQCVNVSFTQAGNCLLELVVVDEGCDRACDKRITVNAPPPCSINSGPVEVCIDDTEQYCGPAGMDSYTWTKNGTACTITSVKNAQCVTVSFVAEGTCQLRLALVDNGCPSNCTKDILVEDCGGGEGRTPGFWKQTHHFGHWPALWCPSNSCPCGPATKFCDVFNCAGGCSAAQQAYANKTLLQVLQQGGGGFKALGRHAVAGLLNSGVDDDLIDYDFSTQEVKDMVNNAIATCNPGPAHSALGSANEQEGGSLGGQSYCNDLNLDGSVNDHDLSILLGNWGQSGNGDVNNDGVVGPADLMILLSNWGSF